MIAAIENSLGNRLKCIVSSRRLDRNAKIYWPVNWACGAPLRELFRFAREEEVASVDANEQALISPFLQLKEKERKSRKENHDFKYLGAPSWFLETYRPYWKWLKGKVEKQIIIMAKEYMRCINENSIGVAVRTWRCEPKPGTKSLPGWTAREKPKFQDDVFFRWFEEIANHYEVFFTCDDQHLLNNVKNRFDVLTLKNQRPLGERKSEQSVKEALATMLILSECPMLYGTHRSSFVECAWWFGGAKQGYMDIPTEVYV